MSRPRVLYAPRNISGQASAYVDAVRDRGFDGEVWSYGPTAFGFSADRVFDKVDLKTDPDLRVRTFVEAATEFDIFHFQYGRSLLDARDVTVPDLWDVPVLKSLGKRVFMHWRGSDVRLRSMHLEREPHSYFNTADVACDEDAIRARIAICRRFCDGMFVSTPGLLDYVPDAQWLPHVVDPEAWATERGDEPAVPHVVHIPSNAGLKGSEHIAPAAEALASAGDITYEQLSGLDRDELKAAIQRADILVDSLTIGDHGLISVEAMAAGTIAVAHIHPRNRDRNPGCPVVQAEVDTIGDVLEALATDPDRRAALRQESIGWVIRRHSPAAVGAILRTAYRMPVSVPTSSVPEWPRSDAQARVEDLEQQIDDLRAGTDPMKGLTRVAQRDPSKFAIGRLVARIEELEAALRAANSTSPVLPKKRRKTRLRTRRVREYLKQNATLHRAGKKLADAVWR